MGNCYGVVVDERTLYSIINKSVRRVGDIVVQSVYGDIIPKLNSNSLILSEPLTI